MLNVKVRQNETPFAAALQNGLLQAFPGSVALGREDVFEAVMREIIATNKLRYGPAPSPEAQVIMRQTVRLWMEHEKSIPFLVPWGSKKPDSSIRPQVDLAELMALRMLHCLSQRVRKYYPPGIHINLRIEDLTGEIMFGPEHYKANDAYVIQLQNLLTLLDFDFLTPLLETRLMHRVEVAAKFAEYKPMFTAFLAGATSRLPPGWVGTLPEEQQHFYYNSYERNYPGITLEEKVDKLATYLTLSYIRHKVWGTGADTTWGSAFLQLNFAPPPTKAPTRMEQNRLYYRTIPLNMGATHIPPWRAKGAFAVAQDGTTATPKLLSWNDRARTLEPWEMTLEAADKKVSIRADYFLES